MRHRKNTVKLGRSSSHRKALFAALVCSLIDRKEIKTTIAKARHARRVADKMVTLGKKGTVAARRRAISILGKRKHVSKLFSEIAPGFADRNGGYTRVIKLGQRPSDGSEMVILQWVESGAAAPAEVVVEPAETKTEA